MSQGNFSGLNVGMHVGDDPAHVQHNRVLLPYSEKFSWLEQVHGTECVVLENPLLTPVRADASFTREADVVCAVMTADCLPLLVCDRQATQVAAIHAGWRGLHDGVIENSIAKFDAPARDILVWLGPAISQHNFEVGDDVVNAFSQYPHAITEKPNGRFQLDLYTIARAKLATLGISQVYGGNHCTYAEEHTFFSHRRATHQGYQHTGRMVSAICLTSPV